MKYFIALLFALLAVALHAQQPFALDTTFRFNAENWYISAVLPQAEGKLMIAGQFNFPGSGPTAFRGIARLNANGTWDPSFNSSNVGKGKLVAWNDRVYTTSVYVVKRIHLDGTLDTDFHMGVAEIPYFGPLQGGDYHVYPDGSVLVSGAHQVNYPDSGWAGLYNLIWFTPDGYLDTLRTPRRGNGVVYQFEELPDGKFICSGAISQFDGQATSALFRVHADGRLDPTFYSGMDWGSISNYLPLADGRFYAAGRFKLESAIDTLFLARFLPDGQLDPTFNNHLRFGITDELTNPWGLGGLSSLTWLDEGRLVLTGQFTDVDGAPRGGICVVDTNGVLLDDHFVGAACGPHTYQNTTYALISGILFTDDDRCYIWGDYHGYTDGTTSDPQQRFVTRLYGPDIGMGTNQPAWELAPTATLRLAPNPSTNWMSIDHVLPGTDEEGRLVVRDIMGRVVYTALLTTHAGQHVWDTRRTTAGTYSVELLDASGGTVLVERAVVQP